jgi:hypothetical protein
VTFYTLVGCLGPPAQEGSPLLAVGEAVFAYRNPREDHDHRATR